MAKPVIVRGILTETLLNEKDKPHINIYNKNGNLETSIVADNVDYIISSDLNNENENKKFKLTKPTPPDGVEIKEFENYYQFKMDGYKLVIKKDEDYNKFFEQRLITDKVFMFMGNTKLVEFIRAFLEYEKQQKEGTE